MKSIIAVAAMAFAGIAGAAEPWAIRGVQLDLGRQMETVEFMKDYIEKISAAGMNTLELYLEGRVKTASTPFFRDADTYSVEDMKAVVEHAAKFGVDVVPCVSCLGHARLFTQYKELAHLAESRERKGAYHQTFCMSLPETKDFFEKYLAEIAAIFPSKYLFVGLDEAWDIGTCSLCAADRKRRGMGPLFREWVTFLRDVCAKNGKRMWMWDDLWEFWPEELAKCPKDVVMCDWRYDLISPWGIRARFADSERVDWMALYAKYGIDAIASCNVGLDNVRSFTEYARRQPNCLGAIVTQWEMSQYNHGLRFPIVIGTAKYWTEGWDDPGYDIVSAGVASVFPSLKGQEIEAMKTLLATGGHLKRPNFRHLPSLSVEPGLDYRANGLAIAVLKGSALKPGCGEIGKRALSEQALLDDAVTDKEFATFRDLIRFNAPYLSGPYRTSDGVRAAKRRLAAMEPDIRRVAARRAAQQAAWRPGMAPREFPGANWGEKEWKRFLAVPETAAGADEWWLVLDLNCPDWYGSLDFRVEARVAGEWKQVAYGCWKPKDGEACYEVQLPFRSEKAPEALRVSSPSGFGICGLNYAMCVNREKKLVPTAVLDAYGYIRDTHNVLHDDWYPAVFGYPDRKRTAFYPAGKQKYEGVLEIALGEK